MITLEEQDRLRKRTDGLERALRQRDRTLADRDAEIILLKRQLQALKQKLFGSPRCEKVSDEQLRLALEELEEEALEQNEALQECIAYTRRRPGEGKAKERIPAHLEQVREEIIPDEVQAQPEAYERIGEEVTEELDIIPSRFVRRVIIRPKFKRRGQLDAVPFIAKLPGRVVPAGIPSARLVAYLIVSKYADHLPLYRLEKIFQGRFGIHLPRQRLCDWIGYAVENWLMLIYHSIRNGLIKGDYLQIDETPIRYLDTERKGKSHTGYLWAFGRPGADLCFDWRLGRGRTAAEAILGNFAGVVQSDGFIVYDTACAKRPIIQVGCWAHARRRFFAAFKAGETSAARYLLLIRQLYAIEKSLPETVAENIAERARQRRLQSLPVLAQIKEQLDADSDALVGKSLLGEAVSYALNQWNKLTAYVQHGEVRIDNNLTEQSIRPTKLGAKNWLFIGSEAAAHRTMVLLCHRRG